MGNSCQDCYGRLLLAITLTLAAIVLPGCAGPTGNTNTTSNANTSANANTATANANTSATTLAAREPANYSTKMTVSGQWTGGQRQGNIPTLQFEFAKLNDNRRWNFDLPQPVGQVGYIEKGNVRYLLIPARNQYVEITQEELGFQMGTLMTPGTLIERLKARGQYEELGTEQVNGRPAAKYRFTGAADTRTQAGTVQTESFVYVDQQTGLPLRAEINTSTSSGATARLITETRDIRLTPDPALFEVPPTLKKVTTAELKQQVRSFIDAVQIFAEMMRQQGAPPAVVQPQPATNSNARPGGATPNR